MKAKKNRCKRYALRYQTCKSHEDRKILLCHIFLTLQNFSVPCKVVHIQRPVEI